MLHNVNEHLKGHNAQWMVNGLGVRYAGLAGPGLMVFATEYIAQKYFAWFCSVISFKPVWAIWLLINLSTQNSFN